MDSHNDSTFFSRISKRGNPNGDSFVVPPRHAQEEQTRQFQKVAEVEIGELKQSLRYVEIQLARSREEIETLNNKIQEQQTDIEKGQDNLGKQLLEKNRFKASSYMSEINQREEELGRMRAQLLNNQDEMKLLTVSREQNRQQKEVQADQIKERDRELEKLRRKVQEQNRLMDSMCLAQKNQTDFVADGDQYMDHAREDIERAERIARTTNKSSFMGLGEKQPRLVSEEHLISGQSNGYPRNVEDPYRAMVDDSYLNDDSIPAEIFNLIQQYRERIARSRSQQTQSLVIDDFFADVHKILKDMQMREMARIRNEHSVEIIKLRKNLESKLKHEPQQKHTLLKSKENFQASKGSDKFIENEIDRQRRALLEENEVLKKRLRALETIVQSGTTEKTKFMEGASWIAKKAHIETEKHIQKLNNVMSEYNLKAKNYVIDESITELNGKEVLKVNRWLGDCIDQEIIEVGERFESIFENVNYHLKEATKNFHKQK